MRKGNRGIFGDFPEVSDMRMDPALGGREGAPYPPSFECSNC